MSVDQYKAQAVKQFDQIDSKLLQNDYFKLIASKTPPAVRPSYLALGGTSFVLLFLIWGFGASFVSNLIGFVYPLYASFSALQNKSEAHHQEKWLTYWVVFSTFGLVESLTDFFLYWIPLYYCVKCAFVSSCVHSAIAVAFDDQLHCNAIK
jgi:receptor expression-enhancing protein 5/6